MASAVVPSVQLEGDMHMKKFKLTICHRYSGLAVFSMKYKSLHTLSNHINSLNMERYTVIIEEV